MAAKSGLGLVPRQGLVLTEAMRQSLVLLRLPTLAAAEAIAREAEENPFLVVEPALGGPTAYDYALDTTVATESLGESLHRQIALQRLDPATEAAARYLVGELREDGYLDVALSDLAAETGAPIAVLEAGLAVLQSCEPAGVGARSLAECLELKLADAGIERSLARASAEHLDDFAEARWARLSRSLGQPQSVLEKIAALLRGFGSAPVREDSGWVDPLVPELAVEVGVQGRLAVALLPGRLPACAVMAVSRGSLEGEALRALHDRARRMAAAVIARRETLLRIGAHIAETQSAFFLGRHRTIVPVSRAEAAAALAIHPTTLGRALAGKALLAGNQVFPLGMFFSRGLPGAEGAVSPFDVQQRIRAMIAQESSDTPLADDRICAQLQKEGVDIARRTVAKYRKCLRIPSSFGRKRRKVT
jgi:RNA polymerase sigma-54 factor